MPRGEKSSHPETQAKRRATFERRTAKLTEMKAERVLKRIVPDKEDALACKAWLKARGVDIADPAMPALQRRRWVHRAKQEMVSK